MSKNKIDISQFMLDKNDERQLKSLDKIVNSSFTTITYTEA